MIVGPDSDLRIRSNTDFFLRRGSSRRKSTKNIFLSNLKTICFSLALSYIIFLVVIYYQGSVFESESPLKLISFFGSAAIIGLGLIYFNEIESSIKSKLALLLPFALIVVKIVLLPTLHLYVVTSHDKQIILKNEYSLGRASLGKIKISSEEGHSFTVNLTDDDIFLLAKEYTVIETIKRKTSSRYTSYEHTGKSTEDEELNRHSPHIKTVAVIPPQSYFIVNQDIPGRVNTEFGTPSDECIITSDVPRLKKFYVCYLDKTPIETNSKIDKIENHSPSPNPIRSGKDVKIEHIYGQ